MSLMSRVTSIFSDGDSPSNSSSDSEDEDGDPGVVRGEYTWEEYLRDHSPGKFRSEDDNPIPDYDDIPEKHRHDDLKPDTISEKLSRAGAAADELNDTFEERTVDVEYENEDDFFTTSTGRSTVVTRYDLEKTVPIDKKEHFVELDRYWVNKPFTFIILFRSTKENEVKYFAVEPHLNLEEERVLDFLKNKLQDTIKYSEEATRGNRTNAERAAHIEEEAYKLLFRYGLIDKTPFESDGTDDDGEGTSGFKQKLGIGQDETSEPDEDEDGNGNGTEEGSGGIRSWFSRDSEPESLVDKLIVEEEKKDSNQDVPENVYTPPEALPDLDGKSVRPQEAVINEGQEKLTDYEVVKLMYYLKRDSVSFGNIDPIKHDINIEDISCDGYNMRVWVYHGDHEQIISNIWHGEKELDDFVINLAQRSGQGISKRQPQVDVTLPDGSRGQLTLGAEVSDHGTNYTIRQFKDVPFTPIDLICWKTFAPEQMAFLWLCIENHKSLIFAGGTASGKTTSLNAISLFIPSNTKIVSIEDTREVELPQRNWVASVTRPSFTEDGVGEVDEFALLEAALRQRPDYIVMGEIRGEEGRTLFQVMSTGHTTYTTFHADSVGEVIKRFTTDPINVSKTLFTALDLVSIQTATRVDGNKVRRNKVLTEINDYNSETDEINVNDVYQWIAEEDHFEQTEDSEVLNTIMFDRGWDEEQLDREIRKREVVIAYLIVERLNTYTQVAATVQAFINGPEIVLDLIANDLLEESLSNLREMESVAIDIDPDKEEMVPRPEPPDDILEWAHGVLEREAEGVLEDRGGIDPDGKLAQLLQEATPTNAAQKDRTVDEGKAEAIAQTLESKREGDDETPQNGDVDAVEDTVASDQGIDSETGVDQEAPESEQEDDETVEDDLSGFIAGGFDEPDPPEQSLPEPEQLQEDDADSEENELALDDGVPEQDEDESKDPSSNNASDDLSGFVTGLDEPAEDDDTPESDSEDDEDNGFSFDEPARGGGDGDGD